MRTGRRWLELRVRWRSDAGAASLVPATLVEAGARGVVEEADEYVAYFEEPDDVDVFVHRIEERLLADTGLSGLRVGRRWQEHEAWEETWKRGLGPRRVTDRVVVHPSWAEPGRVRPDDVVIVVDPGMAFGTAEHATTRGCLRLLDGTLRAGQGVLEIGAGSGILAIAAARLGASEVTAVEGDPLACEAMEENVRKNGVADRVRIVQDWATRESVEAMGPCEGVVANIETGLVSPLLPGLAAAVGENGWLLVSGILDEEWPDVEETLVGLGLRLREVDAEAEWRSGVFVRL